MSYTRLLDPPEINSFQIDNHTNGTIYPDGGTTSWGASAAAQTAFKSGDSIKVSGTCDTHATSIQFTSFDNSLSTTQTLSASGGTFSGTLTAGTKSYDTTAYFKIKAKQSGAADGPEVNSNTLDSYFTMNNRSATFGTPSYTYANGTAMRKGESTTVTCTTSFTYNPLYKYSCEQGTDLALQGSDTSYGSTKT